MHHQNIVERESRDHIHVFVRIAAVEEPVRPLCAREFKDRFAGAYRSSEDQQPLDGQDRQQLPPDHALQRRTYRFGSLWHDAAGFFGALSQYFDYLFQFGQHEEPSVTQKRLPAELRITVRRKPLTIKSYIFYMERTPFVYRRGDLSAHMPPPGSS